jgi:SAM-dependent methyltransferase
MFKSVSHQLRRLTYSWHAVGPGTMIRNSLRWASDPEARCVDSGFDARHGTETNADLTPGEAGIPIERRRAATMYLPTMDNDLATILEALPWSDSLRRQSSFVDLGSGKGRVVFLAAMRSFRKVVGVELSPVLHQVAANNLQIMEKSGALDSPVELVQEDATEFEPPEHPVLTYMYHPFQDRIAQEAIARLVASVERKPRPAALLYCHPTLQRRIDNNVFTGNGMFCQAAEGARQTRRFTVGWTIFTNDLWLDVRSCSPTS